MIERISDLFDDERVSVLGAPIDGAHVERLTELEASAIPRAAPKRRREYATARYLARTGLAELGVPRFDLLNNEDRSPQWPPGIAGSISHSDTHAVVALGRRAEVGTVGVDIEHRAELKPELWRHTMLPAEIDWLEARSDAERGHLALVLFSAKEALYKAQYPVTSEFMSFADLRVELDPQTRRVRCVFQRDVGGGTFARGFCAEGRWLDAPHVAVGVRIP